MTYLEFLKSVKVDNNSPTHLHHIIPRSEGGDDSPENLILLNPSQHAFAHVLYDREKGTRTAKMFLNQLGLGKSIEEITYEDCLLYNDLEAATRKATSEAHKGKPSPFTGKKHTPESIQKDRDSHKGKPGTYGFKGKKHTPETKQKIGDALKGKPNSEEHNRRIGEASRGKIWIHKGTERRRIHKEQLDKYVSEGWKLGMKS